MRPDIERTEVLRIRVTKDEKTTFDKLAKSRGTDYSNLVRQLLYKELKAEQAA